MVTLVDQFMTIIMGCCSNSSLVHVSMYLRAKPNLLEYTAQTGRQKTLATTASSRMPDQVSGFMALDDTLMLHAFAKRVIDMHAISTTHLINYQKKSDQKSGHCLR